MGQNKEFQFEFINIHLQGHYAVLHHEEVLEVLSLVDDGGVRQVELGEDVAEEVAGELHSRLKFRVFEQVIKVRLKRAKKRVDQPVPNARLQLMEKLIILNQVEVEVVGNLSVVQNAIVQALAKDFISGFFDFF